MCGGRGCFGGGSVQSRYREVVGCRVRVPEERCGFAASGAVEGFGLEADALLAGEIVICCDCRSCVDGLQFGRGGEKGGELGMDNTRSG